MSDLRARVADFLQRAANINVGDKLPIDEMMDIIAAEQAAASERARAEAFEEAAKIAAQYEDFKPLLDRFDAGRAIAARRIAAALRAHAGARAGDGGEAQRIERLMEAVEGECDGLAINEAQARNILHYVEVGEEPGGEG